MGNEISNIELKLTEIESMIRSERDRTITLLHYIELLIDDAERRRDELECPDSWYEDPNYSFIHGELYALNCVLRKMRELCEGDLI